MDDGGSGPRRWVGAEYAVEAGHHRAVDDWFLSAHPPQPDDDIVDVGCGSGEFTAKLAGLVPRGTVVGVDVDPSMLEAARRHDHANLAFRRAAVQQLGTVCEPASADLVVSRAVFHWLPFDDYLASYRAVREVLRPGGWFHAESGGGGNVRRLRGVLDEVAEQLGLDLPDVHFPDAGSVLELLEEAGFEVPPSGVTTVAQRRSFDRPSLLGLIRTQAYVAYGIEAGGDLLDDFVSLATDHLDDLRRHDGSFDQTFVRLHVLCRRPA